MTTFTSITGEIITSNTEDKGAKSKVENVQQSSIFTDSIHVYTEVYANETFTFNKYYLTENNDWIASEDDKYLIAPVTFKEVTRMMRYELPLGLSFNLKRRCQCVLQRRALIETGKIELDINILQKENRFMSMFQKFFDIKVTSNNHFEHQYGANPWVHNKATICV
ncbi:MAG: hypothetical protein ACI9TY_001143 [Alphaproteobacteria bacterium]|jgi:hypothetical protein